MKYLYNVVKGKVWYNRARAGKIAREAGWLLGGLSPSEFHRPKPWDGSCTLSPPITRVLSTKLYVGSVAYTAQMRRWDCGRQTSLCLRVRKKYDYVHIPESTRERNV